MKRLVLICVCCVLLTVAPVLAQDDTDSAMLFMLNYTPFDVDVYLGASETPIIEDLKSFTRFIYFEDAEEIAVTMYETGTSTPITYSVEFEALPGTVNYVMLYRLDGDLELMHFEPETLAGEPIDYTTQSPWIYVNLLPTYKAVDVYYDEEVVIDDLEYGEMAVAFAPNAFFTEEMRDAETGEVIDVYEDLFGEPYYVMLDIREIDDGEYYLDVFDFIGTDPVTYLNVVEDHGLSDASVTTFLELLEVADLTETVMNADELNILVPSDAAFDALPAGTLDALRDDPDQLREVLLGHMFAFGQLAETYVGPRKIETLSGTVLTHEFDEESSVDMVDGVVWELMFFMVNDERLSNLILVEEVLLPE